MEAGPSGGQFSHFKKLRIGHPTLSDKKKIEDSYNPYKYTY